MEAENALLGALDGPCPPGAVAPETLHELGRRVPNRFARAAAQQATALSHGPLRRENRTYSPLACWSRGFLVSFGLWQPAPSGLDPLDSMRGGVGPEHVKRQGLNFLSRCVPARGIGDVTSIASLTHRLTASERTLQWYRIRLGFHLLGRRAGKVGKPAWLQVIRNA